MRIASVLVFSLLAVLLIGGLFSCGHKNQNASSLLPAALRPSQQLTPTPIVSWPTKLPEDKLQPWETLDDDGRITSNINLQSQFVIGVDRFLEAGSVSDAGQASNFTSGTDGEKQISWAIYRIPMGAEQPGTIAADINPLSPNCEYYLGVGDYSANTWRWHGPFAANHVRVSLPDYAYTSSLGNLMLAVVAYDGPSFDLVGLGVNARDDADTTAPPAPARPWVSPYNGTILVEWPEVIASDLAGYRIYVNGEDALGYIEGGTDVAIPVEGIVEVSVSAVDISGNESEPSESEISDPPDDAPLAGQLTATAASGMRGDIIALTASGGETYDWDVDGDGVWDMVGVADTNAFANTDNIGIIRPRIFAHTADGGFWMGAVSLIISGNSRPVVSVTSDYSSDYTPLDVNFTIEAEDSDGTIAEYAWDFEGDGFYDGTSADNPTPLAHQYIETGLFNAKFRVTDNEGAWDADTLAISVVARKNHAPYASLTVSRTFTLLHPGSRVELDASGSYDDDGDELMYYWDTEGDGYFEDSSNSPNWSVTYWVPGVYYPAVKVTDGRDTESVATARVTCYRYTGIEASTHGGNAVGTDPSLAIIGGWPMVAHFDDTAGDLLFTIATNKSPMDAGSWYTYSIDATGSTGMYPSLTKHHNYPRPVIAYTYNSLLDLKYAYSSKSYPVSAADWSIHTVDSVGSVGLYPCIRTFSSGSPVVNYTAIAYYDLSNGALKLAWTGVNIPTSAADWTVINVDTVNDRGLYPSMSVIYLDDYDCRVGIAYYEITTGDLYYAYSINWPPSAPGDWALHKIDNIGLLGGDPEMPKTCDSENLPIIIYNVSGYELWAAMANTLTPDSQDDWTLYEMGGSSADKAKACSITRSHVDGTLYALFSDDTNNLVILAESETTTPLSGNDWKYYTVSQAYTAYGEGLSVGVLEWGEPFFVYTRYPYMRCLIAGVPVPY